MTVAEIKSHKYDSSTVMSHLMRWPASHILIKWQNGHIWWDCQSVNAKTVTSDDMATGKTVILDEITRWSYMMRWQDGHILMKGQDVHIWWDGKTVILDEITRRSYLMRWHDGKLCDEMARWQDVHIWWDDKMITFDEMTRWSHLMRCHWGRWHCQHGDDNFWQWHFVF
jgi:hypothetical protein